MVDSGRYCREDRGFGLLGRTERLSDLEDGATKYDSKDLHASIRAELHQA